MADKSVGELIAARSVTPTDLFVLEQNGTAKKLTGQVLENWLVSFADGHGGIQSIVKHSTSVLKDTYRITLADTTTFDFIVTNGKAISSVQQTSKNVLTRTYTITFNDGTSQTFTVTDGRSITDIAKTGTNVLTDTYTISYNDGTTSTFTVKNGKGIKAFAKVSTVGLVDTYRIDYTDNSSNEFTVTNGAKGDKGDNQYVWIKYASQKPTASSHSFGDVADNWIGIYSGDSATAPTDWTQYEWFQIKGEKGDTGAAATVINNVVEYQVGTSGSIIPSGSWQTNVPVVPQGQYLWTRTVTQFNTGDPVTAYSVARFGIDGAGSVSSVANINPDENGNVPLTASDIGALPDTGGDMTGPINMNGQSLSGLNPPTQDTEAATKGYVDTAKSEAVSYIDAQVKKAAHRNLLDNSYFRNPVNQRRETSYTGATYGLDRWVAINGGTVTVHDDGVNTSMNLYQAIDSAIIGRVYTVAAKTTDGDIAIASAKFNGATTEWTWLAETPLGSNKIGVGIAASRNGYLYVSFVNGSANPDVKTEWIALYEGEYTADTLPEYQPKGYSVELAECHRYYRIFGAGGNFIIGNAYGNLSTRALFALQNVDMRLINPTVTVTGTMELLEAAKAHTVTQVIVNAVYNSIAYLSIDSTGLTQGKFYAVRLSNGAKLALSADL